MPVLNSLINIDLAEQQDVFLFSNFELDKKLFIALLDLNNSKAFIGYATDIDLRSQAAAIKMIFSDFLSLSIQALSRKETDDTKFLYSLETNCENLLFKWKSIDREETVISIGNIKVSKKDYASVIKEIFLILSNELSNLNSKVSSMQTELLSLKKEKEDAVKLASEVTDIKDQVEKELFSKFILLLNQKKEQIRNLKRSHDDVSINRTICKKKKIMKPKKLHEISDSSADDVSDSEKADVTRPSSSKHNVSLPFLDDDNEQAILPSPSKRRIRQNNSGIKKTTTHEHKHNKENPKIVVESESEDELLLNL